MEVRIEQDLLGEISVPAEAYYGAQTLRAVENFPITGATLHPEMIRSLAQIKKAAALTNRDCGALPERIANAIVEACDDVLAGGFRDQFPVDPLQGGAGTSANMNMNEVLANVAVRRLGGRKGDYGLVHPNDHVNRGQSTNDVFPSCGKMAAARLLEELCGALLALRDTLSEKALAFYDVIKMGRTQLQDAVPIRLGQEFRAYARTVGRDIGRIRLAQREIHELPLGGTAIGTGINAPAAYARGIVAVLCRITGEEYAQAEDLIDGIRNTDCYTAASGALKSCAVNLSKLCNDLRLMASGPQAGLGEIQLPPRQNGSSIMPGKVNPVIPEVVNQIAFNVIGNDTTITLAAEAGQLEINAFEPVIFYKLFESASTLTRGVETLNRHCIAGITANAAHCRHQVETSASLATALCPYVGYAGASEIAGEARELGVPVRELALRYRLMSETRLDQVLDPYAMTKPPGNSAETHCR